jgi:hypothetical protein
VTARPRPASAVLTLGGPGGPAVITWPGPGGRPGRRTEALRGELLIAAPRHPGAPLVEIADVICGPGPWLDRYPGCAVAAAPDGGCRCRVATRAGHRCTVTVTGPPGAAGPVLAASFVYCWLAAGWPAALLRPAALVADVPRSSPLWSGTMRNVTLASFDIRFEFP